MTAQPRLEVTVPGYARQAPEQPGWIPYWVSHYGHERTVYVYRRAA